MTYERSTAASRRKAAGKRGVRYLHVSKKFIPKFNDDGVMTLFASNGVTCKVGASKRKTEIWNEKEAIKRLRRQQKRQSAGQQIEQAIPQENAAQPDATYVELT